MSYIKEYGIAFSEFRISNKILHPRLGRKGQHAVCYTDEDIVTRAYQASSNLTHETLNLKIYRVMFATTTTVFTRWYHYS